MRLPRRYRPSSQCLSQTRTLRAGARSSVSPTQIPMLFKSIKVFFPILIFVNAVSWFLEKIEDIAEHKQLYKAVHLKNEYPLTCDP